MITDLVNLDTQSLIGVLVWGNIAAGIIVYLCQRFNSYKTDSNGIFNMTIIRFMYAAAFFLMFFRDNIHDVLSVNICCTLLFTCQYMEARMILKLANATGQKTNIAVSLIFAVSVVAFNLAETLNKDAPARVGLASIIIFSIFLLPVIRLVSSKSSGLKRGIGIFYVFLLLAMIPGGIAPFTEYSAGILSGNYHQTLLFISLILMMITNTSVSLLFMKEKADIVMEKMATTDALTKILNRHSFFMQGKQVFENHKSSGTCLALLFFDIDSFKGVNDKYGHMFGDEVLKQFAGIIKKSTRPSDLCCRYGGEEFVILVSNVTESVSKSIAERILWETENIAFDLHPEFRITASVGSVCGVPYEGEVLENYIFRADEALFEAKRTGKNRLVAYGN